MCTVVCSSKKALHKAGINRSRYCGHSFGIGAAMTIIKREWKTQ